MGERQTKPGPLDVIREQIQDAALMDEAIRDGGHRNVGIISESAQALGEEFSCLGREVKVHGDVLQKMEPVPGVRSGGLEFWTDMHLDARGIYRGLEVIKATDSKTKEKYRVTHVLEVGKTEFRDEYGNHHTRTDYTYVCASNSAIIPADPVDAHSNYELSTDIGVVGLLKVLTDKEGFDTDPIGVWRDMAWLMNDMLYSGGEEEADFNIQRVSLLNAMKKFRGFRGYANDIIRGIPRPGRSLAQFELSDPRRELIEVKLGNLAILPFYERSKDNPMSIDESPYGVLYVLGTEVPLDPEEPEKPVAVAALNVVNVVPPSISD